MVGVIAVKFPNTSVLPLITTFLPIFKLPFIDVSPIITDWPAINKFPDIDASPLPIIFLETSKKPLI